MRKTLAGIGLAIALTSGASLQAHGLHVDDHQCGFSTDYDVKVDDSGIAFTRDDGKPGKVFMHDGQLRVDGHNLAVGQADAERLRDYESTVRAVLPEVAGIVREGVDIGFSAMTTVATTFAQGDDEREHLLARLNRDHKTALKRIDAGLGRGEWTRNSIDDALQDSLEGAISELVSTVTAGAVKAALSGDDAQIAALEARADSLDKTIDREVDARADKLDARARALCPRFATLQRLQRSFQFRLADGSPLRLVEHDAGHDDRKGRDASDKDTLARR